MDIQTQFPWQKINATVPFKKARGYFNIWPILGSFITPQIFKGVPQTFLQYNYTATRNFSIVGVTVDPKLIPYIDYDLIIRHNNKDGTISRYKLWPFEVAGTEFLNFPRYTSQVIKKNFSIELWALNPYGSENILVPLFDSVRYNTGADAYGKIYYTDGGSADISQTNEIADFRLTTEGEYYYYQDNNDDGVTIYLDNGGEVVPNGTVFQASDIIGLIAPLNTICTATLIHVKDTLALHNQAATDGVTQDSIAQTKVYISLLKDKVNTSDANEYEETTVSSVPCNVLVGGESSALFNLPITFPQCSAGLDN